MLVCVLAWATLPVMERFLVVDRPLASADSLIVMAGSSSERLPVAATLYNNKAVQRILLANDGVMGAFSRERHRNLYLVEWAEEELVSMRVPREAIITLPYSLSGSIYDALQSKKAVSANGLQRIIVVTSDYHTRRTMWIFDKVFEKQSVAIGISPAPSKITAMPWYRKLFPLSFEFLKYIYYRFRYVKIQAVV